MGAYWISRDEASNTHVIKKKKKIKKTKCSNNNINFILLYIFYNKYMFSWECRLYAITTTCHSIEMQLLTPEWVAVRFDRVLGWEWVRELPTWHDQVEGDP